jgi:hypothetical protein
MVVWQQQMPRMPGICVWQSSARKSLQTMKGCESRSNGADIMHPCDTVMSGSNVADDSGMHPQKHYLRIISTDERM